LGASWIAPKPVTARDLGSVKFRAGTDSSCLRGRPRFSGRREDPRCGLVLRPCRYCLAVANEIGEAPEQVMRILRARRRLGMVLNGKHRPPGERYAAIRTVEQRDMRFLDVVGKRFGID